MSQTKLVDNLDNSRVSKHLGKNSNYESQYNPELLVREPRSSNRVHLNISDDVPPFIGVDIWNAYEVSGLLDNGVPFTCICKISYPCTNKYIVESKSIKLYFNSFNMTKLGSDRDTAVDELVKRVSKDLNNLLETHVTVEPIDCKSVDAKGDVFKCIEDDSETYIENIDIDATGATLYTESPQLLEHSIQWIRNDVIFHSTLLKSNCRVTRQPDWGDVFITGKWNPEFGSPANDNLAQYIISFRDECHFHEEICETIYKRILDRYKPYELAVGCFYTRRGGIDINPIRATSVTYLNKIIGSYTQAKVIKTARQ